ncbi:HNH endonuclease [Desulfurivibrio alkaliphilus]|uniref:HNH endonuclease n=1 Tax=Desulfurivibrio alkaliphilus TaxID=427923 RepID=UPI0006761B6D
MAIAYHGLRCVGCGFHFGETYGVRGEGFIEVHHNKPLAADGQAQVVDPKTDLTPLCANCHRMIHRSRHDVLSIEELRELVRPNKALKATS